MLICKFDKNEICGHQYNCSIDCFELILKRICIMENENEQIQEFKYFLNLAGKLAMAVELVIKNDDMLDLGNRICYMKKCLDKYNNAIYKRIKEDGDMTDD